ncbi:MAG: putative metalloprotease CJM1_0395 family protein [Sedimenticola sp.]|nr:putative metalloprotease CJM1_0395 family protein [Sedimenticola sp.]
MEISPSTSSRTMQTSVSTPAGERRGSPGQGSTADSSAGNGPVTGQRESIKSESELKSLQSLDRAVRAHEQAHLAVAGHYATSGANLQYRKGPDGRQYAVAGEVSIDTSPVSGDPEATIRKAEVIRRAALAPSNPSGQDRRVAAEAVRMALEARLEQQREKSDTSETGSRLEQRLARAATDDGAGMPALVDLLA